MAILDRISNILKTRRESLHDAERTPETPLEKVDEGLKKTDSIIQILEKAIQEGRTCIAEAMTAKQQLEAEKAKAVKASKDWKDRAERAVLTGREDIARDALSHKQESDSMVENYQTQGAAQQVVVTQLEHQLQTLIRKHADAVRNRGMLHARRQAIVTQQKMNQALQGVAGDDVTEVTTQIDQILQEVEAETMADAEINAGGLENRFAQLEAESSVDDQLSVIKKEYGVTQKPLEPWFADEKKALSSGNVSQNRSDEIALKIPDEARIQPPALPPKNYWFDNAPATSEAAPPKKLDDYWFPEEPTPPKIVRAEDYWFSEEPTPPVISHWQPNERTLQAGANVSLSKRVPGIAHLAVIIGSEPASAGQQIELESGILLLSREGKVRTQQDFICEYNRQSPCGAVVYTGERFIKADQPAFTIDLTIVPTEIVRLVIVAAIFEASNRRQTFQQMASLWVRLSNAETDEEISSYLYNERGLETVLILGEIYRYKDEWKFKALGQGFETGIEALVETYGIHLA